MVRGILLGFLVLPAVGLAEGQPSAELSRCEVYLQAHAPRMGNPEQIEERNATALRALNQFRTANLSDFDFSPGDEPVHVQTTPSEALAHRISAIINRDGFKLGRRDLTDGGFEAMQTRVLANVEEGSFAIRAALETRAKLAENLPSDAISMVRDFFGAELVDESRLFEELEQSASGRWFYHSFDVEAPTEVAEALWQTGHLPLESQNNASSQGFASKLLSVVKGFRNLAGRSVRAGENSEILRVDELLMFDEVTQKPLLITVLRLSRHTPTTQNSGGGGKKLRTIELRSEGEELEAELKAKGLVPVKAIGRRRP